MFSGFVENSDRCSRTGPYGPVLWNRCLKIGAYGQVLMGRSLGSVLWGRCLKIGAYGQVRMNRSFRVRFFGIGAQGPVLRDRFHWIGAQGPVLVDHYLGSLLLKSVLMDSCLWGDLGSTPNPACYMRAACRLFWRGKGQ